MHIFGANCNFVGLFQFFKLLSQFLRTSVNDSSLLELLVAASIAAIDSTEGAQRHATSALILECLASVAESQPGLYSAIHEWAKRTASDGKCKNAVRICFILPNLTAYHFQFKFDTFKAKYIPIKCPVCFLVNARLNEKNVYFSY